MLCAIWYHLYNLKNVDNIDGRLLLKVALLHRFFFFFFFFHAFKVAQIVPNRAKCLSHIFLKGFNERLLNQIKKIALQTNRKFEIQKMSTLFRTREAVWYRIKIYSRYRITNNHISIFKIMKIKPSWRSWQICPKLTKKIHQNNSIKCHSWNLFVNFIDKSSCDLAFHKKSLASYFTKKDSIVFVFPLFSQLFSEYLLY